MPTYTYTFITKKDATSFKNRTTGGKCSITKSKMPASARSKDYGYHAHTHKKGMRRRTIYKLKWKVD